MTASLSANGPIHGDCGKMNNLQQRRTAISQIDDSPHFELWCVKWSSDCGTCGSVGLNKRLLQYRPKGRQRKTNLVDTCSRNSKKIVRAMSGVIWSRLAWSAKTIGTNPEDSIRGPCKMEQVWPLGSQVAACESACELSRSRLDSRSPKRQVSPTFAP